MMKTVSMELLRCELLRYLSIEEWKKGLHVKIIYVLLHQADILLTSYAIAAGFKEFNPLMRGLLGAPFELLIFKLIIPIIIAWLVPAKLLLPAMVLLALVVGSNLTQLSMLF